MKNKLISLFFFGFTVLFLLILIISIIVPNYYPDPFLWFIKPIRGIGILTGAIVFICFVVGGYQLLLRSSLKMITVITWMLAAYIVTVELWLSFLIFADSLVDGAHIKAEALHLLHTGTASGTEYFQVYPNNIAITIIRYWLYKLTAEVGIYHTYVSEHLFTSLLLNIMFYFTWKVSIQLFNRQMGAILLFLSATFVPYFMYLLYFYTDTIIVCFIPLLFYLYHMYERKHSFWYVVGIAVVLGVGYQIRPNIVILLPALLIYMSFTITWKKTMINSVCLLIFLFAISIGIQQLYRTIGFTPDDTKRLPNTHWVMLGLSTYGGFNGHDYRFTTKYSTYEEKVSATKKEIFHRVREYGVVGMARLMLIKLGSAWASPSRAYAHYLVRLQDYPILYNYLIGAQKQVITIWMHIWHIVNMSLLIAAAISERRKVRQSLLMAVSLFGVLLFHLLWETQPRYIFMFTPIMILFSLYGIQGLSNFLEKKQDRITSQGLILVAVMLSFLVIGIGIIKYPIYTVNKISFYHYVVKQDVQMKKKAKVDENHEVSQTFQASIPFNFIKVNLANITANTTFVFQIMDGELKKELYHEIFSVPDNEMNLEKVFHFPTVKPKEKEHYIISLWVKEKETAGFLTLHKKSKGKYDDVDVYTDGQLRINNHLMKNEDLAFTVANRSRRANLPKSCYIAIILFVLTIIWVTVWMLHGNKRINEGKS